MNRSNTVSVIEVASESSNNQSNLPNSPATENDNEIQRSAATNKNHELPSSLAEGLGLIDKIEFKQKMRKILCCRICTELRRCPMFQVIFIPLMINCK